MNKKNLEAGKIENVENSSSINIVEACQHILWGTKLEYKTTILPNINWDFSQNKKHNNDMSLNPGRPNNLGFSLEKIKFPKDHEFNLDHARAKAIHFFANHELLAIEVMAKMILNLPNQPETLALKKDIWKTLQDEQVHLVLYQTRLEQLGFSLGDFPVNDYFWKIFNSVSTYESYFSLMALTFESANLDFAAFYSKLFSKHGDYVSSEVMTRVFNDEIHHVKLGFNFFKNKLSSTNVWSAYVDSLPWPITPARAKGIQYQEQHRKTAGIAPEFIKQLTTYKDNFEITERKR